MSRLLLHRLSWRRSLAGALLLLPALVLIRSEGWAQESVLALELNFSNPGARSMGFGGAFAGLADDATAAFANPAGLVQISRPEVSVEARRRRFSTPFTHSGRVRGEPTGLGIDTVSGLRARQSREAVLGLSFLSVVYPKGRWSIALYQHELANYEFFAETQGLFIDTNDNLGIGRFADQRSALDFDVESLGVAVAYRVSDRLSVGVGLARYRGSMTSVSELYAIDEPTLDSLFQEISYLPERRIVTETFNLDGDDVEGSLGLLWKSRSERWRLGAFLRPGATFEVTSEARTGPAFRTLPEDTVLATLSFPVDIPDVYGSGLSFRSGGGKLTLSLEWDRVEYTDLIDDLGRLARRMGELPPVRAEDGDEWHFGAEYAFLRSRPLVALRGGAWLDPDHRFRSTSDDLLDQALRPPGNDELHYSLGLGVAFNRFQIDLATDLSELVDSVSISAVVTF